MRKSLLLMLVLALALLVLVGCGKSDNAPFIDDDSSDLMIQENLPDLGGGPLLLVDGIYYQGTNTVVNDYLGETSQMPEIIGSVSPDSYPEKNGESNFGCEGAHYTYCTDGVAVELGDQFILFRSTYE